MRKIFAVTLLIIGVFSIGWSVRSWIQYSQYESSKVIHVDEVETVSLQDTTTSTTSIPPSEGDIAEPSTTTTSTTEAPPQWIDYPSPDRMIIEEIGIDVPVVITGPDRYNDKGKQNNPAKGTVDLWVSTHPFTSVESIFVEPCELGLTFVTAHTLSNSGVGFDFVDYEYVENDTGISLGSKVIFISESNLKTVTCTYVIVEWPESVSKETFAPLGDTHARYFPKDPAPLETYIELVRQTMEPLLVLSTSYGGPGGREYQSNGIHKYYNAVLLGKLVSVKVDEIEVGTEIE